MCFCVRGKNEKLLLMFATKKIYGGLVMDKDFVVDFTKANGMGLSHLPQEFRSDKDVVHAAVTENGLALSFASKDLQNDKEIVEIAIKSCPSALFHAGEELQNDKEIVLKSVQHNGKALEHALGCFKSDISIVKTAVSNCGMSLQYADESLKGNKEVALIAVNRDDWALRYVSDALKNDPFFMYEVMASKAEKEGKWDEETGLPDVALSRDRFLYIFCGDELKKKLCNDKKYLFHFEPCYLKPARRDTVASQKKTKPLLPLSMSQINWRIKNIENKKK